MTFELFFFYPASIIRPRCLSLMAKMARAPRRDRTPASVDPLQGRNLQVVGLLVEPHRYSISVDHLQHSTTLRFPRSMGDTTEVIWGEDTHMAPLHCTTLTDPTMDRLVVLRTHHYHHAGPFLRGTTSLPR